MYIETVHKLKLKPDEAEILNKCEALLEDILQNLRQNLRGDSSLGDVEFDEIATASDVLQRLNDDKEWY